MAKPQFKHGETEIVTINGEAWDSVAVRPSALTVRRKGKREERDGDCIVPTHPRSKLSREERKIRFRNTLDSEDLMEVIIHETLHAAQPDKVEAWVAATAEDIKNHLLKYGFHRKEDDAA
jgi:hypothetical protein